jgi:predicted nucleic acid-binding protein
MNDVLYIDSPYFLDFLSDNYTERVYARKVKERLMHFKVIIPQIVLGEVMSIIVRDYGDDLISLKKKIDALANELTTLIDPKQCLPVLEKKHLSHMEYLMTTCNISPTDACVMSIAIDDPNSGFLITSDAEISDSTCIYEYQNLLVTNGKRSELVKITDMP